jgi:hypothetical protein
MYIYNHTTSASEAEAIIQAAASVYLKYTQPWFIGLVVHGSAVKGGFIPGWSDIDLQLYLEDAAFDEYGQLPFHLSLSIHRELSQIDPYPFQYIQCRLLSQSHTQYGGLVPHTYRLVNGRLLVPETTNEQLETGMDFLQTAKKWWDESFHMKKE